jgi:UDP-2,4-diacetamido-2,4,6-trideoxy-beta-L-altropyranose hydrolase
MKIVIRADASQWIGSGHIMRCLVLADLLNARGWMVSFACLPQFGDLIKFIEQKGYKVCILEALEQELSPCVDGDYASWLPHSETEDANAFINIVGACDWVIVDHYGIGSVWEELVKRELDCKMLSIDDLNRFHVSDLILDQNLWPDFDKRYMNSPGEKLLGLKYALLRPRFRELRHTPLIKSNQLIAFFGGSDPTKECNKLLTAASRLLSLPFNIKVVTGKQNKDFERLFRYQQFEKIEVVHFLEDFELELARSKYAIGASGVSNWERFCLNVPASIVSVADNQRKLSQYLAENKYIFLLGDGQSTTSDTYYKELSRLAKVWNDIAPYQHLEVDGLGAERVVKIMESY